MSKPKGKCIFCRRPGNLTHGHIWPQWIREAIPFEATTHIRFSGNLEVFSPTYVAPNVTSRRRQGHGTTRKPRNTCHDCNTGWMSLIESAAKPIALPLMRGDRMLLSFVDQMLLATLLCLITMREEFGAVPLMVAASDEDRNWLRHHLHPPWETWQVWIARYAGQPDQHWAYHLPMHIDSSETSETGPDKVNTQTTTLVIGQLCAHLFSSRVIDDFRGGYQGIRLARVWPPTGLYIDTGRLPRYGDNALIALAEALSRDIPVGGSGENRPP